MTKYRRVDPLPPNEIDYFTAAWSRYEPPIKPTGEVIEVSSTTDPTIINKVVAQGIADALRIYKGLRGSLHHSSLQPL